MADLIQKERRQSRRSTRVPIQVQIRVEARAVVCKGETVVVNLHGALLRTDEHLQLGERISVHVSLTGKSAEAKVVFVDPAQRLHFGVELERPENIWGISLPPEDWDPDSNTHE